jgi:hypothetical protein
LLTRCADEDTPFSFVEGGMARCGVALAAAAGLPEDAMARAQGQELVAVQSPTLDPSILEHAKYDVDFERVILQSDIKTSPTGTQDNGDTT